MVKEHFSSTAATLERSISDNIWCFLIHYLDMFYYIFLRYNASHTSGNEE